MCDLNGVGKVGAGSVTCSSLANPSARGIVVPLRAFRLCATIYDFSIMRMSYEPYLQELKTSKHVAYCRR